MKQTLIVSVYVVVGMLAHNLGATLGDYWAEKILSSDFKALLMKDANINTFSYQIILFENGSTWGLRLSKTVTTN